jgi:hypothetical protein
MRTIRPWLARLAAPLLAAALLTATATAQEGADPYAECGAALAQLDVEAFRRATHDGKPGRFVYPFLQPALLGKRCSTEQLEEFFDAAGWQLLHYISYKQEQEYSRYPYDELYRFEYGPTLFHYIIGRKYTYSISVKILDRRVNDVTTGGSK